MSIRYVVKKAIPAQIYLKYIFRRKFNKKLDLKRPLSFNEKLQWLKIYDRRPEYTIMVDKYLGKKYVADVIGEEYIIPTLGVWKRFDEINFEILPKQFALKCTHDSGGTFICKNKDCIDKGEARAKLEKSLSRNYYWQGREWPYKLVKPQIIAEEYLYDSNVGDLRDYKFFCFSGKVRCFKVDFDRFVEHRANYYDISGNLLPFGEADFPPDHNKLIAMPYNLEKMIILAEELSEGIPFVRIDFYEVNKKVYFGEMTFFPASGFGTFTDEEWDNTLGSWLALPEEKLE